MGRITEISVDDVVEVVEEAGEPCGSAEVAEALGCHQRTAWEKLDLAVENGRLYSKKIHRNCKVYWS